MKFKKKRNIRNLINENYFKIFCNMRLMTDGTKFIFFCEIINFIFLLLL